MNKAKLFSALLLFSLPSLAFGSWIMNEKSKRMGLFLPPQLKKRSVISNLHLSNTQTLKRQFQWHRILLHQTIVKR